MVHNNKYKNTGNSIFIIIPVNVLNSCGPGIFSYTNALIRWHFVISFGITCVGSRDYRKLFSKGISDIVD